MKTTQRGNPRNHAALMEKTRKRWGEGDPDNQLWYHSEQARFWLSNARIKILACGRRSGKTELLKREGCLVALDPGNLEHSSPRNIIFSAPTRDQAKRVFWRDIKRLIGPALTVGKPRETDLEIETHTNALIRVVGLDVPERVEGDPIDWIGIDEMANVKPSAWEEHIYPAMDTVGRIGRAVLSSTPDVIAPFFRELYERAGELPDWDRFHWKSADILSAEAIEAARRTLDPRSFRQEYEASFELATGAIYYTFDRTENGGSFHWDPKIDEIGLCFDFNVDPFCCTLVQEQPYRYDGKTWRNPHVDSEKPVTVALEEIHLVGGSHDRDMAVEIVERWGHILARSLVRLYGDATGGARGTAKVHGSDWAVLEGLIKTHCRGLIKKVPSANPAERARVNSFNSRIKSADDTIRFLVDKEKCPMLIRDLENVRVKQGSTGQIDKDADPKLTHASDGVGYYVWRRWPMGHAVEAVYSL